MHRFEPARPLVIGIVGGIAAGKSTVAKLFAEAGLVHVDADAIARSIQSSAAMKRAIAAEFGAEILGPDGALDRAELARRVFADPLARAALEAIVHPPVRAEIRRQVEAARCAGRSVLLDVPLLLEGELGQLCDKVVFVAARDEVRKARAMQRAGWDESEWRRREANQLALSLKESRADATIPNDGDLAVTRHAVAMLLARWS
ncbi:MAG: dephospho-CoA kinase [Planctomycetota bacterium]